MKSNTNAESCSKHTASVLHTWPATFGFICLFLIKYQKSRIVMLQVFSFRDTSNILDYCDLRRISRVWCALSTNNLKTAAVLQFPQLSFPSLHFKPL